MTGVSGGKGTYCQARQFESNPQGSHGRRESTSPQTSTCAPWHIHAHQPTNKCNKKLSNEKDLKKLAHFSTSESPRLLRTGTGRQQKNLTTTNVVNMRRGGADSKKEDCCPPGNHWTHADLKPCRTDHLLAAHCGGRGARVTFSLMNCQMIRVISSPSISTTGFSTLILLPASGNGHIARHNQRLQEPTNRPLSCFRDLHLHMEDGRIDLTHHTQRKGLGAAWPARSSPLGN